MHPQNSAMPDTPMEYSHNRRYTGGHKEIRHSFQKEPLSRRLSPLLFCLCIAPLSWALNKGRGYRSSYSAVSITHQLFMDDLKVYKESRHALVKTIEVVEDVSAAVGMSLGTKKCAVAHMRGETFH